MELHQAQIRLQQVLSEERSLAMSPEEILDTVCSELKALGH